MECADAIFNLTDNNVVLSKVVAEFTPKSDTANTIECVAVQ